MTIETTTDAVAEQELRISRNEPEIGWYWMLIGFTRGFSETRARKNSGLTIELIVETTTRLIWTRFCMRTQQVGSKNKTQ